MRFNTLRAALAGALLTLPGMVLMPAPLLAQTTLSAPANVVTLSLGAGRMVRLDRTMSDFFIADPAIADVQVRSADQLYIYGKGPGETTVYATDGAGTIVYSATIRVGRNMDSIDAMLRTAIPDARVETVAMNGLVLLTGTVAAPADAEDAVRLAEAYLGEGTKVMNRLKTATPLQVMLKVTFAEVNRSLTKGVGASLQAAGTSGGNVIGFARGRDVVNGAGQIVYPADQSTVAVLARALGIEINAAADLNENSSLLSILAEPTLTALSGETASFLAGGEFPIPVAQENDRTTIEFKEYGVSLAFTPTVLDGSRISMRVAPEVSELSTEGAITIGDFEIPAITTRRTATTVELGSGQSLVLSGLLRNNHVNSVDRTPFLANVPVIGALFRSNSYRRNQTELIVVVTPYLVNPVDANRIALPTDGFRTADDPSRILLDREHDSRTGEQRPKPSAGTILRRDKR